MFRDETYALSLVTEFLKENGIEYAHNSANIGICFNEHGCRVKVNDTYQLSIQTHTDVVGSSFAETALQNTTTKKIVYDGTHGYYDVKRWAKPVQLFDHILELLKIVQTQ